MALRWKLNPRPTGLAAIGAGPRGSTLRDGEAEYASVYPRYVRRGIYEGWYWTARNDEHGVPLVNTCNEPVADVATAKAQALAYVKQCLAEAKKAKAATTTKEA
jgi:hypothetical protein